MLRPRYYDMSLPQTTGIRGTWTFLANTEAFRTAYRDEIEGTQQSLLFPRDNGELPIVQQTCLLPWTCREGGENWSMLGQSQSLSGYLQHFIHEMANTAYTFLSRLLSMNWKVRTMWKWGEQSSGIRKSTTSIQNLRCLDTPHYYSRFLAHVAFCNEIVFHSLGLFIYTSFRISCLISFRNRKGRKIYFLFKHLALGTGAVTID